MSEKETGKTRLVSIFAGTLLILIGVCLFIGGVYLTESLLGGAILGLPIAIAGQALQ